MSLLTVERGSRRHRWLRGAALAKAVLVAVGLPFDSEPL